MSDEIPADVRSNDEILAEANAAHAEAVAKARDNPTGDPDEDAFLRAMRAALTDATRDASVIGSLAFDSKILGEIWIDFDDPHAKNPTIARLRVEGDDVPLSVAGRAALLVIVQETHALKDADDRAAKKSALLQSLAAKATGETK